MGVCASISRREARRLIQGAIRVKAHRIASAAAPLMHGRRTQRPAPVCVSAGLAAAAASSPGALFLFLFPERGRPLLAPFFAEHRCGNTRTRGRLSAPGAARGAAEEAIRKVRWEIWLGRLRRGRFLEVFWVVGGMLCGYAIRCNWARKSIGIIRFEVWQLYGGFVYKK